MTDADLVYNAFLRAERRLEATANDGAYPRAAEVALTALATVQTLREEIGRALSEEGR